MISTNAIAFTMLHFAPLERVFKVYIYLSIAQKIPPSPPF
jgi:hypothetical protein